MSGYAPNPSTAEPAASLTSGLLARKGQATPAVDAMIHEGVDVDLDTNFAARPKRRVATDVVSETPYPDNSYAPPPENAEPAPATPSPWRQYKQRQRATITLEPAPETWTTPPKLAQQPPLLPRHPVRERKPATKNVLRATVKFRMPAQDFVRLRFASRAIKESCQTIIIDAIAAYLDANDIETVDDATTRQEVERLVRKRSGR